MNDIKVLVVARRRSGVGALDQIAVVAAQGVEGTQKVDQGECAVEQVARSVQQQQVGQAAAENAVVLLVPLQNGKREWGGRVEEYHSNIDRKQLRRDLCWGEGE